MEKKLILSSGQCNWQKCFACGWGKLKAPVNIERLKAKIERENFEGIDTVKVFASGSFFDEDQFTKEFRGWFANYLKEKGITKLTIESRPEFITQTNLDDFKGFDLTVSIGLECANDLVLEQYDKGFTVEDYLGSVKILHENKMHVRTYLMVNIPFGSKDLLDKSVKLVQEHFSEGDSLVLINTFPHSKSKLFNLWIEGKWMPMTSKEFEEIVSKYEGIERDTQNYLFLPKFPPEMKKLIKGANSETLNHRFFEVWQDYFQRFYETPKGKDWVLFVQCSFKKPYSRSKTHKAINGVLVEAPEFSKRTHLVVLSNPGVIPMEYDSYYPFTSYDWPEWEETDQIREEYRKVVGERIKKYLESHKYEKYFSYLKPSSDTYEALKTACDELNIELVNLFDLEVYEEIKNEKNPVANKKALEALGKKIKF